MRKGQFSIVPWAHVRSAAILWNIVELAACGRVLKGPLRQNDETRIDTPLCSLFLFEYGG